MPCTASYVSFVWAKGEFYHFSFPEAYSTTADGINEKGEVTGSYKTESPVYDPATGRCYGTPNYGFVHYPDGTFRSVSVPGSRHTVVNKISPSGWMVGPFIEADCYDPSCTHSFLWKDETFIQLDVPGGVATGAIDINSHGEVVGVYSDPDPPNLQFGFLFSKGEYQTIQFLDALSTIVTGINDRGEIVGRASNSDEGWSVPFVISGGEFIELTVPGYPDFLPLGINNRGEIAGGNLLLKPTPGKE